MAFLGTPIGELVTPNLFRITGVSLAAQASATIGLAGASETHPAGIILPPGFLPPSFQGQPVDLASGIRVSIAPVSGAPGPFTNLPPSIEKTGATPSDFQILITNTKVDLTTQTLEIYVESLSSAAAGARTVNIIGPLIGGDESVG
jgi:hypothetical protein